MALILRNTLLSGNRIFESVTFNPITIVIPVISLVGSGTTINLGDAYADPGYTATDDNDGDITNSVNVTGSVDINTVGTYTLRYNVTNSQGNASAEVIRLVTVRNFWQFVPPQARVIPFNSGSMHASQDKDASLSYWLDFSNLIGDQTISSVTVTPDTGLTVACSGENTVQETDEDGTAYTIGSLIGLCISGGSVNVVYDVLVRFTLSGGDIDERTLKIHVSDL